MRGKSLSGKTMRKKPLYTLVTAAAVAAFMLAGLSISSAGVKWEAGGLRVSTATPFQQDGVATTDGAGGAIITYWQATGAINGQIFAQRVDSSGTRQWTNAGRQISTAVSPKVNGGIIADGSGGAFNCWIQYIGANVDVYAQRIDADGTKLWAASGKKVSTSALLGPIIRIVPDGAGGLIIVWSEGLLNAMNIRAQRLDGDGNKQWGSTGKPVCTAVNDQYVGDVIPDGSGGAIVAILDQRTVPTQLYAQRIDSDGARLWTTNGRAVCTQPLPAVEAQCVSDGAGGAIITWSDQRLGPLDDQVFCQRMDSNGDAQWTTNGVAVCGANGARWNPRLVSDGSGGAIVGWEENRVGVADFKVYAQRLGPDGHREWTANGVRLCGTTPSQTNANLVTDTAGGAIVAFQDFRSGNWDIYAQRVDANGDIVWAPNGMKVGNGDAISPPFNIIPDGSGGAIATWRALPPTGSVKVFTQKVSNDYPICYLAEGSTAWGFDAYITIENPNSTAVHAKITYMTNGGPVDGGTLELPAESQATVNPRDKLGNQDFSTKVVCTEHKTIAVDRTMNWTGPGAASPEAHCSVGVPSPSRTWYLPEGSTNWGFECWLLIQNPNDHEASCDVTYMIEGETPQTINHKVPANSRMTFNMATDIGNKDASIRVVADRPVIPERAMYRNSRREGHDSIGTIAPAADYYLAEGSTAWGFTNYVLIQNPNNQPNNVTVTYMTNSGPKPQTPITMPANSRETIRVNDVLPNTDLSTKVHGTLPVIAERAMYWGEGSALGEACHDSIGMAQAHTTFYLPDGQTSDGHETWTLVQNPNAVDVEVEISYLTPTGAGNVVFTDNVPANSRKTYDMSQKISGRAAVMVTSTTPGRKIMVERAMYWNTRGAGTDTIGGYSE